MFSVIPTLTKNVPVAALSLLLLVEAMSVASVSGAWSIVSVEPVLRISEINGPRIDSEAAMVVVHDTAVASTGLFVFLLLTYGALLFFNFAYTFGETVIPQWRLEGLITICALFGWYLVDPDRTFLWFPFAILKSGLILFACYAYLLEKKRVAIPKETIEA